MSDKVWELINVSVAGTDTPCKFNVATGELWILGNQDGPGEPTWVLVQ